MGGGGGGGRRGGGGGGGGGGAEGGGLVRLPSSIANPAGGWGGDVSMATATPSSWREKPSLSLAGETLPITCIPAADWTGAEMEGGGFGGTGVGHQADG